MRKSKLKHYQSSALNLIAVGTCCSLFFGCKSRFFSFSEDAPIVNENTPPKNMTTGGVAIGENEGTENSGPITSDASSATRTFVAVKGEKKEIPIGSSATFQVNGKAVDVKFEKIIEDSRCPKDVVCIWEGQAKLQFTLAIPSAKLTKTVVATLRAGHPELGQVNVGAVALALVKLTPVAVSTGQKTDSPVASVVVGNAP